MTAPENDRTLRSLAPGDRARVTRFEGGHQAFSRLIHMGLTVGSELKVLRAGGRLNGPMLIARGETRLAIGRGLAEKVFVRKLP
jgi:ferrous iron transport protein A